MSIDKLTFMLYNTIGHVYDNSMSMYELVNACVTKLNEVIDTTNEFDDNMQGFIDTQLDTWEKDGTLGQLVSSTALQMVISSNYNLVGDGVADDSSELQKMFNDASGKILILEKGKTFGIPNSATVTIPDNVRMFSNGSKFKKTSLGSNFVLQITGQNVHIDYLEYVPFTDVNEVGVQITGTENIRIDKFVSISDSPNCGGASVSRNALFINGDNSPITGVKIGVVQTVNWERPVQIRTSNNVEVDYFDINFSRTAVYIRDSKHIRLNGSYIRGLSSTADGNPGQNGILIEAYSDYATEHITVKNWHVQDTGEHGYRIGGQNVINDVIFENCYAKNVGCGKVGDGQGENGIGHGGCGFKVLGPTTLPSGQTTNPARHRNIKYVNCTAENGRTDVPTTKSNFAGFQIGKCVNVTLESPVVKTDTTSSYGGSPTSFVNGIEIIGSEEVTVSNPIIAFTQNDGILIYDYNDGTSDFGTLLSRVNITGGVILNPTNNAIHLVANNYTFRRVRVSGTIIDVGNSCVGIKAEKTGGGSFSSCHAQCEVIVSTSLGTTYSGLDSWICDFSGVLTSNSGLAANGSTFRTLDGYFKIMKAGIWTTM